MANQVPEQDDAGALVAQAVERMAAGKIALGLPPLAVVGIYGLVQSARYGLQVPEHVWLVVGAVLSMVAMIAYGMQAVSRVLERPNRWGGLVFAGSFVPVLFAVYVVVTQGLFLWQQGGTAGLGTLAVRIGLILLAVAGARAQWRLNEVHLLAREMAGVAKLGLERGNP
jgi:hypothetical protein